MVRSVRPMKLANVRYPLSVRRSQVAKASLVREVRPFSAFNPSLVISKQFLRLSSVSVVRLARCRNPSVTCPPRDISRLARVVRLASTCNPLFVTPVHLVKSRLVRAV